MPKLTEPQASTIIKTLLLGDSGTGKTGALVSLVQAGYKLRILDMDNKINGGILPIAIKKLCPDKMGNVEYESLRDAMKMTAAGPILSGVPKAFTQALGLMEKWSDGTVPSTWGPGYIFVLDSLTFLSDAAYDWVKGLNPGAKDPRQWFYAAQNSVEKTLAFLTGDSFATNVIVICHVAYQQRAEGTLKGFPASIGSALGPTIPTYFENMVLTEIRGGKRTIQTLPTALVDLKNPAGMTEAMPVETGLAKFFSTIKG